MAIMLNAVINARIKVLSTNYDTTTEAAIKIEKAVADTLASLGTDINVVVYMGLG